MSARVCYFFALLFAAGGAWFAYSAEYDSEDGAARAAELKQKIRGNREHNDRLALEIEEMRVLVQETKANPSRMEELARLRLQLIKTGEVFVLPSDGN